MPLRHVRFEQTVVPKLLAAHRTGVRRFLGMNPLVNPIGLVRLEPLSASLTLKLPLASMDRCVFL